MLKGPTDCVRQTKEKKLCGSQKEKNNCDTTTEKVLGAAGKADLHVQNRRFREKGQSWVRILNKRGVLIERGTIEGEFNQQL